MKLKFRLKSTYSGISGRFKWNGQMLLIFVCSFENIRETEWKWSSTVFYFAKGKGNKKGPPDHSCKILCSSKKPQFNSYAPFLYSLYAKNIWFLSSQCSISLPPWKRQKNLRVFKIFKGYRNGKLKSDWLNKMGIKDLKDIR